MALIDVDVHGLAPGYRINSNVTVTFSLVSSDDHPYSGEVWVTVSLSNPSSLVMRLLSLTMRVQEGQANISVPFISEGTFSFILVCGNQVSNVTATLPTFVAGTCMCVCVCVLVCVYVCMHKLITVCMIMAQWSLETVSHIQLYTCVKNILLMDLKTNLYLLS